MTGMSVFYFDLRGRAQLPVSQNSPTSTEVLFILIDSSEKHFIWGRNNMMCHCVYISVFRRSPAFFLHPVLFLVNCEAVYCNNGQLCLPGHRCSGEMLNFRSLCPAGI